MKNQRKRLYIKGRKSNQSYTECIRKDAVDTAVVSALFSWVRHGLEAASPPGCRSVPWTVNPK